MNTSDSIGQSIGQPPSGPKHRTTAKASDNRPVSPGHTIGQSIGRNGHLGASDTATPLRGVAGAPTTPAEPSERRGVDLARPFRGVDLPFDEGPARGPGLTVENLRFSEPTMAVA
jgi:hypothetical protein